MSEKYYRISESELRELLADSLELQALNGYGVDNWDAHGEAQSEFIRRYQEENGIDPEENEDFSFQNIAERDIQEYYDEIT